MKKVLKEEEEAEALEEFEYGLSDVADEIEEKIVILKKTKSKKEKDAIKKRVNYLMDLYDNVTGHKNYNRL